MMAHKESQIRFPPFNSFLYRYKMFRIFWIKQTTEKKNEYLYYDYKQKQQQQQQ